METGTRIGNYELLEKLGEGGMAVIYKAKDLSLHHEVVIKFPKDKFAKDPDYLKVFEEEGKKLAQLKSPHILSVITADYKHVPPYVVLEYLEGKSLEEVLEVMGLHDRGVLPEEKAIDIIRKVAEGLSLAHRAGIVHCDINPANIMISYGDRVTIMDFGIARSEKQERLEGGAVVGNPGYMAPEQIEGQPVDPRTDIYALGGVFYEMVTGRTPFESDTIQAMLQKALHGVPANPRGLNRNLSPRVASIILKMLEKDAGKRYQTMDEVLEALKNVKKSRIAEEDQKKKNSQTMLGVFALLVSLGILVIGAGLALYSQNLKKEKASMYINPRIPENFIETKESAAGFVEPPSPTKKGNPAVASKILPISKPVTAKTMGRLMISTTPPDAEVFLNNVYTGNSPLFKKIRSGFYSIKIMKNGYSPYRAAFRVASDETKRFSVKLLTQ